MYLLNSLFKLTNKQTNKQTFGDFKIQASLFKSSVQTGLHAAVLAVGLY